MLSKDEDSELQLKNACVTRMWIRFFLVFYLCIFFLSTNILFPTFSKYIFFFLGKNLIQRHIIYFLLCKNDHGNYIFAYYECFGFCELWEDWVNLTLIYVGRWIIKNHNKLVKDGDFCRQWLWTLIVKKVGKLFFSYCWVIFTLPIIIQLFKFDFFYYLFFYK